MMRAPHTTRAAVVFLTMWSRWRVVRYVEQKASRWLANNCVK